MVGPGRGRKHGTNLTAKRRYDLEMVGPGRGRKQFLPESSLIPAYYLEMEGPERGWKPVQPGEHINPILII